MTRKTVLFTMMIALVATVVFSQNLPGNDDRSGWDVAALDVARNVDYLSEQEKGVIL